MDGTTFKKRRTLKGHTKQGQGLSFSPDGKLLVSSGKDSKYLVWTVESGQQLLSKILAGDIENVAFSPAITSAGEYRLAVASHQREAHLITLKLK